MPALPRDAKDFPSCEDCCIAAPFICCPVHGVRPLPDWLAKWFEDLQDRRDCELEPKGRAARGYWSQAVGAIVACPECNRKLVAPSERAAVVRCPKCLATWRLAPSEAERAFRANDTLSDETLPDFAVTNPRPTIQPYLENAHQAASARVDCDLELIAQELSAELQRRGLAHIHGDVLSYVRTAHRYGFLWAKPDSTSLRDAIDNLAGRWQAANSHHDWEDLG